MTVQLDQGLRNVLRDQLRQAFPDATFDDADVEAFALAVQRYSPHIGPGEQLPAQVDAARLEPHRQALDALAQSITPGALETTSNPHVAFRDGDPFIYYWVQARHARQSPAGYDPFVGQLAMVRVRLPQQEPRRFVGALGSVEPSDHLIATVREANDKYAAALGYSLARVDLITPPRQLVRFGAISVLLGYRSDPGLPTCYILEAGTALGQAKVVYLGKTLDAVINRRTGYKPTTFSCSDNAYTGTLTVEGDEPKKLHVTARDILGGTTSASPYLDLQVTFERQTGALRHIWPGFLIARAALIVEARKSSGLKNTCEDT